MFLVEIDEERALYLTALFEDPLYVYVALALAELVLAAVWYEKRKSAEGGASAAKFAPLLLVPPVLAVGVFWGFLRVAGEFHEQEA